MRITFCGHGTVPDQEAVTAWLRSVCAALIAEGAREFYLGGYGAFDHLCAHVLKELRKDYPDMRLVLILPYLNSNMVLDGYDETIYPPLESVPKKFAISRRNEWMVAESDVAVAYVTHSWGGAAKTLAYARRKKKRIIPVPIKNSLTYRSQRVFLFISIIIAVKRFQHPKHTLSLRRF